MPLRKDTVLTREAEDLLRRLSRERPPADYVIGVGDVLLLEVWKKDTPMLKRTAEVRADGTVVFPLVGELLVKGRTEREASRLLKEKIARFVKDPFASVTVTEVRSRKMYVFGQVKSPGVFPLRRPMRLLEVVLRAGGVTPEADLARTLFVRRGKVLPVNLQALLKEGAMENNIYVESGDTLLVPSITDSKVFVFGEVNKPGVVFIRDGNLSLMEAVSECAGLTPEADPAGIRIIRGPLSRPEIYIADINQLVRGNAAHNVPLRRGDIVFVPAKGVVHWHRFMQRILPPLTDLYLLQNLVRSQ